ncbi:hypothetical protein LTS12_015381 [Elasticomyces elasticus]|nr:hypothetical protein LTS12_015381 [Elasticomyces elasticus]
MQFHQQCGQIFFDQELFNNHDRSQAHHLRRIVQHLQEHVFKHVVEASNHELQASIYSSYIREPKLTLLFIAPQPRAARSYPAIRSSQHQVLDKPSLGHDTINNQPRLCDYAYYVFEKEQQFFNVICQDFKHSEQYEILNFACLRNNTIDNVQVLYEGFAKH